MRIISLSDSVKTADDVRNLSKQASGMPLSDAVADLASVMSKSRVGWALCGGLAVGVHARPRGTDDIDVIIASESYLDAFMTQSAGKFRKTREHAMGHKSTGVEVEILTPEFLKIPSELVAKVIETASLAGVGKSSIPVVSREGLIAMKLCRGGDYDRGDIKAIIRNGGDVDLSSWPLEQKSKELFAKIMDELDAEKSPVEGGNQ